LIARQIPGWSESFRKNLSHPFLPAGRQGKENLKLAWKKFTLEVTSVATVFIEISSRI